MATLVVAAHAVASRAPKPILSDPFAEVVVRGIARELFTRIMDGITDFAEIGYGWCPPLFGIRARTFDDFILAACRAGIRQAVTLGSGLDCRAYRLGWPAAMSLFEVDRLVVMDWKQIFLKNCGVASTARHRCVGVDLHGDWPSALVKAGFDQSQPTAWIVEGVLPAPHEEIFDPISALSLPGSCLAADYFDGPRSDAFAESLGSLNDQLRSYDSNLKLQAWGRSQPRDDPAAYLAKCGWIGGSANLVDIFGSIGRRVPASIDHPKNGALLRILRATRLDGATGSMARVGHGM
jgi:methyltransferase (TIGR00027 family)